MEKLTDITPLKQVSLPGVENVNCTGLVLVVGPNSSGKTHLLRDIQARMSGATRSRVVAQDIDLDVPLYTVLLEVLEREHLIKSSVRGDSPLDFMSGNGQAIPRGGGAARKDLVQPVFGGPRPTAL